MYPDECEHGAPRSSECDVCLRAQIEELENLLSSQVSVRDLMIRDLKKRVDDAIDMGERLLGALRSYTPLHPVHTALVEEARKSFKASGS